MPPQLDRFLDPNWLTEKLRAHSVLEGGEVIRVETNSGTHNQGFMADITRLELMYSRDASGSFPNNQLLKTSKMDLHPELMHRNRYEAARKLQVGLPIPTCYAIEYDQETNLSILMLEDLSEMHFQKPSPLPPSNRHCEMIIESLARVHASWWNSPAGVIWFGLQDSLSAFEDLHCGDLLKPG